MDRSFFNQPNDHCVNRLVQTSGTRSIVATEDIYDHKGIKLLARGLEISPAVRERLIARTLKKPLETCLRAENGLDVRRLSELASEMFTSYPNIAALAGPHAERIAGQLGEQRLAGPIQLLMTAMAEQDPASLLHAIINASISASLALRLRLSETVVAGALTAGLLHDIGEFYIDPRDLGNEQDLSFEQWKRVAVHPRIGALLLTEFSDHPAFIARAVQEHHERLDGSGYPSGLTGAATSELGQILMVAEVLAAVLPSRHNPQGSALLAMRLVPGQFASQLVATLAALFEEHTDVVPPALDPRALQAAAREIDSRLRSASIEARRLCGEHGLSNAQKLLVEQTRELCARLISSLHSTGVIPLLEKGIPEDAVDPTIALELQVVTAELQWRMRAIARHVALAANIGDQRDTPLGGLVEQLYCGAPAAIDGDHDPTWARHANDHAAA